MAVEAGHLSLLSPQILGNRFCIRSRERSNFVPGNGNMYGGQMGYGVVPGAVSGTTTAETFIPMYGSLVADSVPPKTPMKSDSGLTYAVSVSRKRPREDAIDNHPLSSFPPNLQNQQKNNQRCGSFTCLGEDISLQIQRQQLEIDRFIAQHTEKVRMEIEERRKRYSRRIIAAVEESIMKKLRAKEEEIEQIGKLNWTLEERVKSLCVENQIWRDLAHTNEATANALRSNLEQVLLAQAQDDQQQRHQGGGGDAAELMDDAQSCCGSNCVVAAVDMINDSRDHDVNSEDAYGIRGGKLKNGRRKNNSNSSSDWLCRNCGKDEASVLLLPCRHLCMCSVCGPSVHTCPICKCTKNASVHVNLLSS